MSTISDKWESLYRTLKEKHDNAPVMGMGEFIPACKREIARMVGSNLTKSLDPEPIPLDKVRLLMDNNDMKKPMALFDVPGVVLHRYLCSINDARTEIVIEILDGAHSAYVPYRREAKA